jgi:REP element-mobilizing transposase RayT
VPRPRKELVHPDTAPYYHAISRCVRRAFLCGLDPLSGRSYEHRKAWMVERLSALQGIFAVEICAYAVMSNHYHLVLRMNPEQAQAWSEAEVLERWSRLFALPALLLAYRDGRSGTEAEREAARHRIAQWRARLGDLSWFMRSLNEHLARRANAEDGCTGRFWEGRFKSQALLDDAAVLTCMSYVDLNPVRAGLAATPEDSAFTSIQQRIAAFVACAPAAEATPERPRLVPLGRSGADPHPNSLNFTTEDYLELVDWAGRALRENKCGAIPETLPPILQRLQLDPVQYLQHVSRGGRHRHAAVLGRAERIREAAQQLGRRSLKGLGQARRLYLPTRQQ